MKSNEQEKSVGNSRSCVRFTSVVVGSHLNLARSCSTLIFIASIKYRFEKCSGDNYFTPQSSIFFVLLYAPLKSFCHISTSDKIIVSSIVSCDADKSLNFKRIKLFMWQSFTFLPGTAIEAQYIRCLDVYNFSTHQCNTMHTVLL